MRARARHESPEGICDNVSRIAWAVAVLLVVGDDVGAGVVDLMGSQGFRLTPSTSFSFVAL